MRLLRVLMVLVAGLIVCVIAVDSYGARVPIRNIGIPIYLGDPDGVEWTRTWMGSDKGAKLEGDDGSCLRVYCQVVIHVSHPLFGVFGVGWGTATAGGQTCIRHGLDREGMKRGEDDD